MLELDIQQVLSQAASFLILLWLLRRFAWRPLLHVLDARKQHIEDELRKAAKAREEVAILQDDYAKRLSQIEHEARAKIQQAILDGKRISTEVQDQARVKANEILTKAKDAAVLEVAKAKVTLRDQMADMTVDAVGRILKQKLDAKTDRKLIDSIVDELEQGAVR